MQDNSGKIVFSWGQASVRKEGSGPSQNHSYSPPLAWSSRVFFSDIIHCKYLVEFLEVKVTKVRGLSCLSLPGDFTSQSVHREPPAICQSQLRFSYSSTDFCRGCCPGKLWLSVLAHPPLQFWCSGLPCNLIFLKDLRGVDFSVYSLFGKEWWLLSSLYTKPVCFISSRRRKLVTNLYIKLVKINREIVTIILLQMGNRLEEINYTAVGNSVL